MALTAPRPDPGARIGQSLRAMHGEGPCGDQVAWWLGDDHWRLALADGLGHGQEAHAASVAAMRALAGRQTPTLEILFADCDQALIDTRGVALAVVDIRPEAGLIEHASVGNVRTLVFREGGVKRLGGARGIVGAGFSGLRVERLAIAPGDWILLFSDGIRENAGIVEDLIGEHPSNQLADRLLARWASERDDASLLLYRHA